MNMRKRTLKLYKILEKKLLSILNQLFPREVYLEPVLFYGEIPFQQLIDRTIYHTKRKDRVIWKLPPLCIDKETNQIVDCEELGMKKLIERLMM